MTTNDINWLLMYLLVLVVLVEGSAALVVLYMVTLGRTNPKSRQACRRALTIGLAAAAAGGVVYVILAVRIGIIDLNGSPRGRLAVVAVGEQEKAR